MTKEQLEHYLKGGVFQAIYRPVTMDISERNEKVVDKVISVSQNADIFPIQAGEYGRNWGGQHRFNSPDVYGWMPEEDLADLRISRGRMMVKPPEPLPVYAYRLTYKDQDAIRANFGKGFEDHDEMVVYRNYTHSRHHYVVNELSEPGFEPDEIAHCCWSGGDVEWEIIFTKNERVT